MGARDHGTTSLETPRNPKPGNKYSYGHAILVWEHGTSGQASSSCRHNQHLMLISSPLPHPFQSSYSLSIREWRNGAPSAGVSDPDTNGRGGCFRRLSVQTSNGLFVSTICCPIGTIRPRYDRARLDAAPPLASSDFPATSGDLPATFQRLSDQSFDL